MTPTASRCIVLQNCFDPTEETGTAWVKELEEDIKMECEQKYGKVTPLLFLFGSLLNSRSFISMLKQNPKVKCTLNSTVYLLAKKPFKD